MAAKAKKKAAAAASDKLVPVEQSKFERYSGALYLGLAFFIPFAMMFVCFAVAGVQPFGNNQILVTDLWHQYYPFLVDFHDKLQHGGSMLWTWRSGGGTNYIPLMAYYLASPLNFFSILVPLRGCSSRCSSRSPSSATTRRSQPSASCTLCARSSWATTGTSSGLTPSPCCRW